MRPSGSEVDETPFRASADGSSETERLASLMERCTLFAGVSSGMCRALAGAAVTRVFAANSLLFRHGEPLLTVFLLESGAVKLTQPAPDGQEKLMWVSARHDAVGIFGVPDRGKYADSARSLNECRTLAWDWPRLLQSEAAEQIQHNIGRIISEHLAELEDRLRDIAGEKNVLRRLGLILAKALPRFAAAADGAIEIPMSREDLAEMAGTTPFSVDHLLTEWQEAGIIEKHAGGIIVPDPARLIEAGARPKSLPEQG